MRILSFPEFELHQLRGYIQDIFLVVYPHKIMLLDGTCRPDVDTVLSYITGQLQRPATDLKLCVVSHMHPDHAGGAHHYRHRSQTQVLASPFADKWYTGLRGHIQHLLDTAMGQFVAHQTGRMNKRLWYKTRVQPDYLAQHQQTVPNFADWQILCTPGHTNHDITLYHPQYQIAYVGDLVLRIRQKFLLPFPINLPQLMAQSLHVLSQQPIQHLLMAHGGAHHAPTHHNLIQSLTPKIWNKPARKFRFLQPFVGVNNTIERSRQRMASLHETDSSETKIF